MAIVTLLSDYGTSDGYVAEIRAVLLDCLVPPHIVDITHAIPSFDIRHGAFELWRAYSFFPAGTWHLGLVEPAGQKVVGGIYACTPRSHFVGPDNGLLKWSIEDAEKREGGSARVFRLDVKNRLEPGYWGRDSYAAFVRDALNGRKPALKRVTQMEGPSFPQPVEISRDQVRGEVLTSDHFGNVITSLPINVFKRGRAVFRGHPDPVPVFRDYVELPVEGVGLIPGSNGLWEISARNASAAERTGLEPGDEVSWIPEVRNV